jgi:hypothetical protein
MQAWGRSSKWPRCRREDRDSRKLTLRVSILVPGRHYAELIFSARIFFPSDGSYFGAQLGFDLRTTGVFTTATVPEPSTKDAQIAY